MPEAQKEYLRPEFWPSIAEQPAFGYIQSIIFVVIALLALGLIPIVTKLAGGKLSWFLRWMMLLGMLGYAIHAVDESSLVPSGSFGWGSSSPKRLRY
jgi:hypothetical protein